MRGEARESRPKVRDEVWYLIHPSRPHERVIPDGEEQIAELIGVPLDDLTNLPFGVKSTMWMSRSAQIGDSPYNRPASHALSLAGFKLGIRGLVVVHHEKADLDAEMGRKKTRMDIARRKPAH